MPKDKAGYYVLVRISPNAPPEMAGFFHVVWFVARWTSQASISDSFQREHCDESFTGLGNFGSVFAQRHGVARCTP